MKSTTVEKQLAHLRPMVKSGLAHRFHKWLVGIAVALVILSAYLWNPIPLMIALFLGFVGLAESKAGPNIAAAIKAYDSTRPNTGEVTITISSGDTTDHYHARVIEAGQPDWAYEFVPQQWTPAAGAHDAHIWRAGDGSPPKLAIIENGIMIPRGRPTRALKAK